MTEDRRVYVVIANLMFVERVTRSLGPLGGRAELTDRVEAISASPAPVVLDLDHERLDAMALLARLKADPRTAGLPVLAYGSHVREDVLEAAARLGATAVPRSAFSSRMPQFLAGLLGSPEGPGGMEKAPVT